MLPRQATDSIFWRKLCAQPSEERCRNKRPDPKDEIGIGRAPERCFSTLQCVEIDAMEQRRHELHERLWKCVPDHLGGAHKQELTPINTAANDVFPCDTTFTEPLLARATTAVSGQSPGSPSPREAGSGMKPPHRDSRGFVVLI